MPTHGEQTGILVDFQQAFYIRGIGECLSRQRWGEIGQGGAQIPYSHWVLSVGAKGAVLAFCAATSDAKGRKQYPMVTALAGPDLAAMARMDGACDFLRRLSVSAAAASGEKAVAQVFESGVNQLASFQSNLLDKTSFMKNQQAGDTSEKTGMARVFHALSVHGAGYRNARVSILGNAAPVLWCSLAAAVLEEEAVDLTLVWQAGKEFADLFLDPPDMRSLGYLFTDLESRPLSSTNSYRLADGWESTCAEGISQWAKQEELAGSSAGNSEVSSEASWVKKTLTRIFRIPS